jgi:hypothetical protein
MSEGFDLEIENYSLKDMLNLFQLPENFDAKQLKDAKKYVYKVHPDKSKLPKEYFIFFAKAYKYIYHIYEFKSRKNDNNTEYEHVLEDNKSDQEVISKAIKRDDFQSWFNEMFEKYKLEDEDDGYEDWLKAEDNQHHMQAENASQLQQNFDKYKQKVMKEITVHKGIDDVCNHITCGSSMINNKSVTDYSNTDLFNNSLQYNDIKRAHTETFVPVTQEDYDSRKKYKNTMELEMERNQQKMHIPTMEESRSQINNRRDMEDRRANDDAYALLKCQEKQERLNQLFMKDLRLLK